MDPRNKKFAELCGIFWHEPKTQRNINLGWKCSCGEHNCRFVNPDYISDPRLVLNEMVKRPDWRIGDSSGFISQIGIPSLHGVRLFDNVKIEYILDTTGLLLDKGIEFMEERK
jgi:hypothetical protein